MSAAYHTTAAERGPRVGALVHDAERDDVQALLEIAINALETRESGGALSDGAAMLAAQIAATMTPSSEPAFAVGQTVKDAESVPMESVVLGTVTERYLNERGDWEYQVRHPKHGTWAYGEEALID